MAWWQVGNCPEPSNHPSRHSAGVCPSPGVKGKGVWGQGLGKGEGEGQRVGWWGNGVCVKEGAKCVGEG